MTKAEFYGINPPTANLELLARFFEKYPEYVEKAFLSVKVCMVSNGRMYCLTLLTLGNDERLVFPTVDRPLPCASLYILASIPVLLGTE